MPLMTCVSRIPPILRRLSVLLLLAVLTLSLTGCSSLSRTVSDLDGKRVGVLLSYETDYVLFPRNRADLVWYDTLADMILALKFNKVDVIAADDLMARMLLAGSEGLRKSDEPFGESGYVLYFNSGSEELKDEFNDFLEEFAGTETYRAYLDRLKDFDGVFYEVPDLSLPETGKVLSVAVDAESFPRCFLNAGIDTPLGFDLEPLLYFARRHGYHLEFSVSHYNDIVFGLLAGIYDIGAGALSDVYNQEVEDAGLFCSDTLYTSDLYFIEKTGDAIRIRSDILE